MNNALMGTIVRHVTTTTPIIGVGTRR